MRISSLFLILVGVAGCSRAQKTTSVQDRLTAGDTLLSTPGGCAAPATGKTNGSFRVEKGEFVVRTNQGGCEVGLAFKAEWLRKNKVILTRPRKLTSCGAVTPDPRSRMTLDFEWAGSNVRMYSSQDTSCGWLKWKGV